MNKPEPFFDFREFEEDSFRRMEVQVCELSQTVQFTFIDHTGDYCGEPCPVALPLEVAKAMLEWIEEAMMKATTTHRETTDEDGGSYV